MLLDELIKKVIGTNTDVRIINQNIQEEEYQGDVNLIPKEVYSKIKWHTVVEYTIKADFINDLYVIIK